MLGESLSLAAVEPNLDPNNRRVPRLRANKAPSSSAAPRDRRPPGPGLDQSFDQGQHQNRSIRELLAHSSFAFRPPFGVSVQPKLADRCFSA